MVVGPVSCFAKIHSTAAFAQQSGKFSRLGVTDPPYPPFSFVPAK